MHSGSLTTCAKQAAWRERKAQEFPDDARNARSGAALRAFATYIEALPDSDPALLILDSIQAPYDLDVFAPGEEASRIISRIGFDMESENFAQRLMDIATTEAKNEND